MRIQKVREKINWNQTTPSIILWVLGMAWTLWICLSFNKSAQQVLATNPQYALLLILAVVMNTVIISKNIPLPHFVKDWEVVNFQVEQKTEEIEA